VSQQRSRNAAIDDWVSRQAITTTLAAHSRGVDRADANLLGSAYHPDAEVDYSFFVGPAAQLVAMLAGAQKGQPVTLHRTSNMWIKTEGRRARSESYVFAYAEQVASDAATQRFIGGRYLDTHEERDGEWRLTHRAYVMDFNINRESTAVWPEAELAFAAFAPRGGQGTADIGRALLALHAAGFQSKETPNVAANNTATKIDEALAKQDLHDLGMAYARAVDRADAPLLASIFHDDATVMAGMFNGNAKEFAVKVTEFVRTNLERCFHSIANEWYEVQGDRAIGESYLIGTHTAGGKDTLIGGRYIDEYERRGGVWKIKTRTFVVDWNNTQPTSFESGGMYAALTCRGRFGADDPVYAFWTK
jgi:ketosteroid isomerase-like protein